MESKSRSRLFLSVFFFLSGFVFSSWASRIPTIKSNFNFNDAHLGSILLAMPISSLIGLPISGWLVSRFDSRIPLTGAFVTNAFALSLIGLANSTITLILAIGLFSLSLRILNISINTQALTLQKHFENKIIGSFHGLWSSGGIAGVGFSTLIISLQWPMHWHLVVVSFISLLATLFSFQYLLKNDRALSGNKLILGKPDPSIFYLGLLVFFAAFCEGGMFDWSGIYFKEIVKVDVFTSGYLIFMVCMSIARFASDIIIEKIGMAKTYMLSATLIVLGILLSVIFPYYVTAMVGFSLVGFGTASIIPMTYSLAGTSKKYSAGMAVSIIATYGIVGMLVGPPLIGYLAHALSLKVSFVAFAISGFMLIPISQLFFKGVKNKSF